MSLIPQNRQEDWYQQMINASTGNYLPSVDSGDAGKVLTVANDGSWEVANVPTELPSVSGTDENKVLTVDSSGDWVAEAIPSQLPTVTSDDKDKYLHTNDTTGALEWSDVSGGGGVTIIDVSNDGVLNKTWKEIWDAMYGIVRMPTLTGYAFHPLISIDEDVMNQVWSVSIEYNGSELEFATNLENGYPVVSENNGGEDEPNLS